MTPLLRRILVTVGAIAVLGTGGLAVVAAGAWTDQNVQLATPASVESLTAQLAAERARSGDLRSQLTELALRAGELEAAVSAAEEQAASDMGTASDLRAELARTRRRLAQLERTIRAREAQLVAARAAAAPAATRSSTAGHEGEEREDEHEGDD